MDTKIINLPNGYIAVLVPSDAYEIHHGKNQKFPDNAIYFRSNRYNERYLESVSITGGFKIIGVLFDDLKEEDAREIFQENSSTYQTFKYRKFDVALESLQSFIESKGGKLKNPISPKPNLKDKYSSEEWMEQFEEYQQSEKELQKAVIIKIK